MRDKTMTIEQKRLSMAADKQNLQDAFLNHVRKAKVPVTIFLINGVKLQGVITWFDNFCVLLRRDGQSQLVYKHAISTIMPGAPISLYEESGGPGHESPGAPSGPERCQGRLVTLLLGDGESCRGERDDENEQGEDPSRAATRCGRRG